MQISSTSCGLPAKITEIVQIVIPDEHVKHVCLIRNSLQPIQLVHRLEGCFYSHEVLCLINEDRADLQTFQSINDCISHIEPLRRVTKLAARTVRRRQREIHQMIFDGGMISELSKNLTVVI